MPQPNAKSKVLTRDHSDVKNYSYSLDGVNLNFCLRSDVKTQLKAFKTILEMALKEVTEDLNKK